MGDFLSSEFPIRIGTDNALYRYSDGVYNADGEVWAKTRIRELLKDKWRSNHVDETLKWLKSGLPTLSDTPNLDVLNLPNGLLNWKTGVLNPHSPEFLSTVRIPVAWHEGATCSTIDKFLAEALPQDAVDLFYELAGYSLYQDNPLRKSAIFYGPTGTGKSTALKLFAKLIGARNISNVSLQDLSINRFSSADLYGKLANICGDLDATQIKNTGLFKQITGGDVIRAEVKYGQPFTFKSYALPVFSANKIPGTTDQTDAWFERWIIVPMMNQVTNQDIALDEKLWSELEGFLVNAVEGLRRLMERGCFDLPASVLQAGQSYREGADTVQAFITAECKSDPKGFYSRPQLYRNYKQWCEDGNEAPLPRNDFNARVGAFDNITPCTLHGDRGWKGLRERCALDEPDTDLGATGAVVSHPSLKERKDKEPMHPLHPEKGAEHVAPTAPLGAGKGATVKLPGAPMPVELCSPECPGQAQPGHWQHKHLLTRKRWYGDFCGVCQKTAAWRASCLRCWSAYSLSLA